MILVKTTPPNIILIFGLNFELIYALLYYEYNGTTRLVFPSFAVICSPLAGWDDPKSSDKGR